LPKKLVCQGKRKKFKYRAKRKKGFRFGGNNNLIHNLYTCGQKNAGYICDFCSNSRLCKACFKNQRCECRIDYSTLKGVVK